jgi:hypothetical protein
LLANQFESIDVFGDATAALDLLLTTKYPAILMSLGITPGSELAGLPHHGTYNREIPETLISRLRGPGSANSQTPIIVADVVDGEKDPMIPQVRRIITGAGASEYVDLSKQGYYHLIKIVAHHQSGQSAQPLNTTS